MEIDLEKLVSNALSDALREGFKTKITQAYGDNPINKMLTSVIESHLPTMRLTLDAAITSVVTTEQFKQDIRQAVQHNLAKLLIQRFGGELEKQVNALKSDPMTRARITLAIEQIVAEKSA